MKTPIALNAYIHRGALPHDHVHIFGILCDQSLISLPRYRNLSLAIFWPGALCHHNIAHQLIQLSCFTPFGLLCVNKNTAVIIGGWRLRTINRNSAVYLNISQHSNRRWRSIFKRLLSPALVIGQCGNKYNICGQHYKWLQKKTRRGGIFYLRRPNFLISASYSDTSFFLIYANNFLRRLTICVKP